MTTLTCLRVGAATQVGRNRPVNEDRLLADPENGIFLIADGMGGHVAGEVAAETALQTILTSLAGSSGDAADRVRSAINAANSQILILADQHAEWSGMGCVVTVVLRDEGRLTWGHVGDSRLYLARRGSLAKLTSDQSPVGACEDAGELTEHEAMRHPRRNEVFENVGSNRSSTYGRDSVAVGSEVFPPDSAFLLCSDGLSDVLTRAQIAAIISRFAGDAEAVARQLVAAALEHGGNDDVTVIFGVEADFAGQEPLEPRARHAITRVRCRTRHRFPLPWQRALLWLLAGILLGLSLGFAGAHWNEVTTAIRDLSTRWK